MRLIDADDFFARMENDTDLCAEMETDGLKALKKYLDMQSTAYDIGKIVEEFELHSFEFGTDTLPAHYVRLNDAIEIVKQGDVSDDVCEWNKNKGGVGLKTYKISCFGKTLEMPVSTARGLKYCPYCGKKIKVVE